MTENPNGKWIIHEWSDTTKDESPYANLWYYKDENGKYVRETSIEWKKISENPDTYRIYYEPDYTIDKVINSNTPLRWITGVEAVLPDEENQYENTKLQINFNTGDSTLLSGFETGVKYINYDDATGNIDVTYAQEVSQPVYVVVTPGEDDNPDLFSPAAEEWYEKNEDNDYVKTTDNNYNPEKIYYKRDHVIKSKKQTIGNIKSISEIKKEIREEGEEHKEYLVINYKSGDSDTFEIPFKSIEEISRSEDQKQLVITYTDGSTENFDVDLAVTGLGINEYNQLSMILSSGKVVTTAQSLDYAEYIDFNTTTQKLEAVYNNSPKFDPVENIDYVNDHPDANRWYILIHDSDQKSQRIFGRSADITPVEGVTYYKKTLRSNRVPISPALNYIQDMSIGPVWGSNDSSIYDTHLFVKYSDPDKQTAKDTVTHNGTEGWVDLGSVKETSGLYIDYVISTTATDPAFATIDKSITTLNTNYPLGYKGNPYACIAVGGLYDNKKIYGYRKILDSNGNATSSGTWYFLGSFSASIGIAAASVAEYDNGTADNLRALPVGGLWFVTEEVTTNYDELTTVYGPFWEDY